MAQENLSAIRPVVVVSFPLSPEKGDTVVLTTDGHLYTYDGSGWVDNGAGGGSGLTEYQVRQRTFLLGG